MLSWAFTHFRSLTLALLGGFLLGSLNKVWPWKYTVSYTINSKGAEVPLVEQNVMPSALTDLTGEPSQALLAIGLMFVGCALVVALDRIPARGE